MRWWGSFQTSVHNVQDDTFQIASHLFGGNAESLDALRAHPLVAPRILCRVIAKIMGEPVDLDGERRRFAKEIQHEWAKRVLSTELQSFGARPKHSPEPNL